MHGESIGQTVAARLYRDHVDAVHAYLDRRLGSQHAADLTAETFRIAFEQGDRFDAGRGSERAWLYGIATNLLRRHWRTESRRLRALAREAAGVDTSIDPLLRVDERLDASSSAERLLAAVADLSPDDRDLLVLVAWERLPHREVADVLGIPNGTVRSRLHRIRTELRSSMQSAGPEREVPELSAEPPTNWRSPQ